MKRSFKAILAILLLLIAVLGVVYLFGQGHSQPVEPVGSNETAAVETSAMTEAPDAAAPTDAADTSAPSVETDAPDPSEMPEESALLDEYGSYTTKDDVALYIHQYGHLPSNFITKKDARALGWSGGSLERFAPGKCIGGDRFGNYEGLLPEGHNYTECDIDTLGASKRGAKRIVFSDDGLIFYTDDHYESFTQLYGEGTT